MSLNDPFPSAYPAPEVPTSPVQDAPAAPATGRRSAVDTVAKELFSPAVRLWIYGVCLAAIPLLVAYGRISGDAISMWTDFASAVLGVSGLTTAIANVKR